MVFRVATPFIASKRLQQMIVEYMTSVLRYPPLLEEAYAVL